MSETGEGPKNLAPIKDNVAAKKVPRSLEDHKAYTAIKESVLIIMSDKVKDTQKKQEIGHLLDATFLVDFGTNAPTIGIVKTEKEKPSMSTIKPDLDHRLDIFTDAIIDAWIERQNNKEIDALGMGIERDIRVCLLPGLEDLAPDIAKKMISNDKLAERGKWLESQINPKRLSLYRPKQLLEIYNKFLEDLQKMEDLSPEGELELISMGATVSEKIEQLENQVDGKKTVTVNDNTSEKTKGKEIDYRQQYQEYVDRNHELLQERYENYLLKCEERGIPTADRMSFSDLNRGRTPESIEEFVNKARKIAALGKDLEKNRENVEDYFIFEDTHGREYVMPRDKKAQLDKVREVMTWFVSNDDPRSISNSTPFGFLDMVRKPSSLFDKDVRNEVDAFLASKRLGYYMKFANGLIGGGKNRQAIDAQFEDLIKNLDQTKLQEIAFLFTKGSNGIPFSEMWNIMEINGFSMNFHDNIAEGYKTKINIYDPSKKYMEGYHGTLRKIADKNDQESKDFRNYLIAEKQELLQDILDAKKSNTSLGLRTTYDVVDKWILADAGDISNPQSDFQKTSLVNPRYLDKENGQRTNYFFDGDYARKELVTEYFKWKVAREALNKQSFRELYGDLSDNPLSIEDQRNKAVQLTEMAYDQVLDMLYGTGEMSTFNSVFGMHDDYREVLALQTNFVDRKDKGKWCGPPIWKDKLYSLGTTFIRALAGERGGKGIYEGAIMAEEVKVYEKMQPENAKINLYFWYSALLGKKLTKFIEMVYKEDWRPDDFNSKFMRDLIDTCRKVTDYNVPGATYEGEPAAVYDSGGKETLDSKLKRSEGLREIVFEGIIQMMANGVGLWGMSDIGMDSQDIANFRKRVTNTFEKIALVDNDGNPIKDEKGNQLYRELSFISTKRAIEIYKHLYGFMLDSADARNDRKLRTPG